jgi:hypothetical protein
MKQLLQATTEEQKKSDTVELVSFIGMQFHLYEVLEQLKFIFSERNQVTKHIDWRMENIDLKDPKGNSWGLGNVVVFVVVINLG